MPAQARDADVRDPEAARAGAHDREDPLRPAELADRVRPGFSDVLLARDEVTVVVERDGLIDAIVRLRDQPDLSFGFLASLTATDHPAADPRFWVVYELRSVEHAHRLRVKVGLPGEDPRIPSVTPIYPTANWHERETFDLYGIVFDGHPDLERILMPGDWEGYPLRKDEELGGVDTRYHGAFIPPVDERTNP